MLFLVFVPCAYILPVFMLASHSSIVFVASLTRVSGFSWNFELVRPSRCCFELVNDVFLGYYPHYRSSRLCFSPNSCGVLDSVFGVVSVPAIP